MTIIIKTILCSLAIVIFLLGAAKIAEWWQELDQERDYEIRQQTHNQKDEK